jgi:hypothetical protein
MGAKSKPRWRWLQFSLGTLMIFVAGTATGLFMAWSLYLEPRQPSRPKNREAEERAPDAELIEQLIAHRSEPTCQGLLDNLGIGRNDVFAGKRLVFFARYALADNHHRIVFVYNPRVTGSFTPSAESVVITDGDGQLIAWKELSESGHVFEAAEFSCGRKNRPTLALIRNHIGLGGGWLGTYRFSLAGDDIEPMGGVERAKPNYEEKLEEWLASPKEIKDLIRWVHGNEGVVSVMKDESWEPLSENAQLPARPFTIGVAFTRDDQQHPLDLTPLRGATSVSFLSLTGKAIDDRVAPIIETLSQLEELEIQSAALSDDGLHFLDGERLPKLRTLTLGSMSLGRQGFKRIGSLHALTRLTVDVPDIMDADLPALQGLRSLRFLELHGAEAITCTTLPALPKLRVLVCRYSATNDDGLRQIAKQPSLLALQIDGCTQITDRGLESLANAKTLARVSIAETNLTGEGFRAFPPESGLMWIRASKSKITDGGLAAIARLKRLRYLGLSGTAVKTAGVKYLAVAASLERLDLGSTKVDDGATTALSQITSLREACVSNTDMSEEAKKKLEASVPGLVVLKATGLDDPFGDGLGNYSDDDASQ